MRIILQNWNYWISSVKLIKSIDLKDLIRTNLPNFITTVGIILTTWLNLLIWNEPNSRLLILLLAVSILLSDLIDGWLARHWKIISSKGDFLDKLRDKLFSCSLFIYFLKELWRWADGIWLAFVKGLIILILLNEFFLMSVWIVGFVKGLNIDTHWTGKVKTDAYFIAIGWWFFLSWLVSSLEGDFKDYLYKGLIPLLFIGSVFGILSVVAYLQRFNSSENK